LGESFNNFREKVKEDANKLKEDLVDMVNHIKEKGPEVIKNTIDNFINNLLDGISKKIHDDEIDYGRGNFNSVKLALNDMNYRKILKKKIYWKDFNNSPISEFIKKLPKVDLHCHLGGCARTQDLIEIAKVFPKNQDMIDKIEDFFTFYDDHNIKEFFRQNPKKIAQNIYSIENLEEIKALHYANIIQYLVDKNLVHLLECIYEIQDNSGKIINLSHKGQPTKWFSGIGLKQYLNLGAWAGSTLLQNSAAINKAIECLCNFGRQHNLKYLELRFNPLSYSREDLRPEDVYKIVKNAILKHRGDIIINIIFIANKPKGVDDLDLKKYKIKMLELVMLIEKITENQDDLKYDFKPRIVGFDIAGLEEFFHKNIHYGFTNIISSTRNDIFSLFSKKIFITIHSGETDIKENPFKPRLIIPFIDAVIQLGADRLGHALNISEQFFHKIKRKNITIELCPSSNCQISTFLKVPWVEYNENEKNQENLKNYPLEKYLKHNLIVTVNTDDPGISKTNWTKELFLASALSNNPLEISDIIRLIYNGLESSFLLDFEKQHLIRIFDKEIKDLLIEF